MQLIQLAKVTSQFVSYLSSLFLRCKYFQAAYPESLAWIFQVRCL